VDNFPSFTELEHLPNWYEGEDAGRARQLGMQDGIRKKNGRNIGEFGSFRTETTLLPGPGCWGHGTNPQKTGKK